MDDRTHSFGYWLRRRRKALDLTQEALAEAVSCSRFAIRKIEADERRPSRGLAERLASRLGIAPAERDAFLNAARARQSVSDLALDRLPLHEPGQTEEAIPLVGRVRELGQLLGLLARVTAGTGHVALIEGEPGIGKSRLLAELAAYAEARGILVLATNCYEIERAMPYQPVIDLVTKAAARAPAGTLEALPAVARAELAALVPALADPAAGPSLSADFPQARQARLFQAVVQLFEGAAGGRQQLLAIDDLHWADDASAQFVHYLARQAATRPMLLLCAYREEEVELQERLGGLVRSLLREPHARRLALARLQPAETEALLERLQHPKLRQPGLAARLHRETDGNPFFLLSMVHALAQDEAAVDGAAELPLPEALRAAVRARIAHVDPTARAVLDAAAVLGRRFDFDAIAGLARRPEAPLIDALEALVRRRLLREDDDGGYDFAHDKVREVVYRGIGAARRAALHRAAAEALEAREADSPERDARLAEHYERAHEWQKALRHVVLAAERSQRLFALRDALHGLDRAVALAQSHPEAIAAGELTGLLARRGAARALAGQTERAVEDLTRVIDDARRGGERTRARDAVIQLGMTYRRGDDYARATACLLEALDESRALGDERRVADTLYHLGTVYWSDGRNAEAIACHGEAVEVCERLGLADLVAVQAWHGRGEAHYNNLEPGHAIACFERSIALARGIGERSYESENLMMIGYACTGYMGLADYARAEAYFESALGIAREADLQWHLAPTLLGLHHVRGCTGRREEALRGMRETLQWLEGVKQPRYQVMARDLLAHLLLEAGRAREALESCEAGLALADRHRIRFWRPRLEANRAIARLRLGDLGVGQALEAALAECRRHSERTVMTRCLEGLAELALARGDRAGCLSRAGELLALVEPAGLRELAERARGWRDRAAAPSGA